MQHTAQNRLRLQAAGVVPGAAGGTVRDGFGLWQAGGTEEISSPPAPRRQRYGFGTTTMVLPPLPLEPVRPVAPVAPV